MRVGIISPVGRPTSPGERGARRDMISLLTEGLRDGGVDVSLFPAPDSPIGQDSDGDDLNPGVAEWLRLGEFLEGAEAFDLIHNWAGIPPFAYSAFVKRPLVTTIHELCSKEDFAVYRKYAKRTLYVSTGDAERSADLRYAATVHPGIDCKAFAFEPTPGDYLLVSGAESTGAGVRDAVKAALRTDRKLVIAGPIEDAASFEIEVQPHLKSRRIQYLDDPGPVQRDLLLARAQALICRPADQRPFPLIALEANAFGTPVIGLAQGVMREIVIDGVNGFLVSDLAEVGNAVRALSTLSRADCRKVVEERFSRDRMAAEYIKLYEGVLEECRTEERRPWGYYEVLSDLPDHKVKRIVVYPKKRLSLQRHSRRFEHWTVISGSPTVTVDDDEVRLGPGESIEIPRGARHRILNPGDDLVVFIEVQTGDYFGEDDIERFEDDFGRVL